ncbi:MAG: GNAT family N-acetyltransferase [Crenarchaeota archaeon]|nr:GNAT family N-acetyltransferase [Thermoproteota archaeon]
MASSFTIRKVNPEEVAFLSIIEQRCFEGPTAYSCDYLKYLVLNANSTCLVEVKDSIIRGFIIIMYCKGSRIAGIETIDVDPDYQNKSIGLCLLSAAEEDMICHDVLFSQLEVSEGNKAAINLYRKSGYVFKEKLPNYYQYEHNGTRNAIRLIKSLQQVH